MHSIIDGLHIVGIANLRAKAPAESTLGTRDEMISGLDNSKCEVAAPKLTSGLKMSVEASDGDSSFSYTIHKILIRCLIVNQTPHLFYQLQEFFGYT